MLQILCLFVLENVNRTPPFKALGYASGFHSLIHPGPTYKFSKREQTLCCGIEMHIS